MQQYDKQLPLTILDLGTGSGIIGITLARNFKRSSIVLADISINALKIARKNVEANNFKNIQCIHSNWYENVGNSLFNIIVSNPPYISKEDPHLKHPELTKQPQVALISDDKGLKDINTIVGNASKYLE